MMGIESILFVCRLGYSRPSETIGPLGLFFDLHHFVTRMAAAAKRGKG